MQECVVAEGDGTRIGAGTQPARSGELQCAAGDRGGSRVGVRAGEHPSADAAFGETGQGCDGDLVGQPNRESIGSRIGTGEDQGAVAIILEEIGVDPRVSETQRAGARAGGINRVRGGVIEANLAVGALRGRAGVLQGAALEVKPDPGDGGCVGEPNRESIGSRIGTGEDQGAGASIFEEIGVEIGRASCRERVSIDV